MVISMERGWFYECLTNPDLSTALHLSLFNSHARAIQQGSEPQKHFAEQQEWQQRVFIHANHLKKSLDKSSTKLKLQLHLNQIQIYTFTLIKLRVSLLQSDQGGTISNWTLRIVCVRRGPNHQRTEQISLATSLWQKSGQLCASRGHDIHKWVACTASGSALWQCSKLHLHTQQRPPALWTTVAQSDPPPSRLLLCRSNQWTRQSGNRNILTGHNTIE